MITVKAGGGVHHFRNEPMYVSFKIFGYKYVDDLSVFREKNRENLVAREAHDGSEQSYLVIASYNTKLRTFIFRFEVQGKPVTSER